MDKYVLKKDFDNLRSMFKRLLTLMETSAIVEEDVIHAVGMLVGKVKQLDIDYFERKTKDKLDNIEKRLRKERNSEFKRQRDWHGRYKNELKSKLKEAE